MSEYLGNEKNNIFTWLSSFHNPFNVFKAIKWLAIPLKIYSWPKKLYQVITNLLFLANIPTPDRV